MRYHKIPDETIRRLPIYLRHLLSLTEQGLEKTSSQKLADSLGINPWQIRKDFSYFGYLGTRGVGYKIYKLQKQIYKILKLDIINRTALVGVGNLGSAVLAYPGFKVYGFDIIAAFDADPEKVGKKVAGITIENTTRLWMLDKRGVNLAIITVPQDAAQKIADALVKAGVRGILNFSPQRVTVPRKVKVISIDIALDLARMPYYIPAN